ncbi:DUF6622 family protein [Candidatus Bandiella numerosa]|uniref:DUF6622 family protein n=1 Tax=Candidatus Bandiella numerosa TaxID=2570586 RepID=UPI001F2FFF4B|nr:DUF6622 family protein [Candidatus Bandiella numerosa]
MKQLAKLFLFSTPSWVYLLLLYYIWGEINAPKEKVIQLKKTIIDPIIMILLLAHTLISTPNLDDLIMWLCLVAIFTGISISYFIIATRDSIFDDNNQLKVPYSKITFMCVIAMFVSKYWFQYIIAVNKEILNDFLFEELYIITFSIFTGLLIGKSIGYFYNIKKSKIFKEYKSIKFILR